MTCRDPDRPSDPIGRTFNRSSPADARQRGGGGLHRRDSCGLDACPLAGYDRGNTERKQSRQVFCNGLKGLGSR